MAVYTAIILHNGILNFKEVYRRGWIIMVGSKQANKLLAMLLIVVMLLTNPIVIGPLYAASRENNAATNSAEQFELNSNTEITNSTVVAKNNNSNLTDGERFNQFINELIPYYVKGGKKHGPEWLRTTDIKLSFTENYKPMFTLTTLQPFSQVTDQGQLCFWQGRYAHQSDNNTANLGVGWRKLSADKQQLLGLNLFYDYGFKNNLSRVGTGIEYFNKLAEYRANLYLPTSGDRQTGVSYLTDGIVYSYIRAVRGFDYEVGTSFEHARWLSLYASGYFYDNNYKDDEVGYKLRSVMQLTPRFSAEVGYDKSNLSSGSLYGKILYQLGDGFGPALSASGKGQAEKKIDLTYKLLQKVERNNTIKTETFTKFVSYQGSMRVSVTNASGLPIQGARVQAYQNGNPVGASVLTDTQGNGIISGLNVGTYTAIATYFSYTGTSSAVAIQKDQVVDVPPISLPVVAGSAVVNVLDANAQGVSGVSVTAEMVSGEVAQAEKGWFDRIFGVQVAHASGESFTLTLMTQADGTVHFNNLPPGTYRFTATYNNQVIKSTSVPVENGVATKVTAVVLNPPGSTSGSAAITVVDGSGKLVRDATVSVLVNGDKQTAITKENGIAVFKELPAGQYTFSISKENYVTCFFGTGITNGVTTGGTVVMVQETGSANITVTDGSAVLGDATVTVVVDGSPKVVTTNNSGVATFRNLPVGNYTFSATKQGYNTVNSGTVTISNGTPAVATISLGLLVGSANITINDGSTNLSGATVNVPVNGNVRTVVSNHLGVARFNDLPIGDYVFTGTKQGYSTVNSGIVTITNGGEAASPISLAPQGGNVSITVSANDGGGIVPTFTVDGVAKAATNSGNIYTLSGISAGNHTIMVASNGYTTATLAGVSVTNGDTTSSSITLTAILGNVAITVNTNDNGAVTPTFKVDGIAKTATNSGSVYTLSGLAAGSHRIEVIAANYTSGILTGVNVTNNTTTATSITLAATIVGGNIAITVSTSDSGNVVPSFTVDGVSVAATNSGNVYTLSGISAGSHSIIISGAGYTAGTLSGVNVTNNNTTTTAVTLNRQTGSVAITVATDDSGVVTPVFTVDGVTKSATKVGNVYTISGIATGSHRIEVAGTNYTTGIVTGVSVTDNATTTANITLVATIVGGSVAITVSTSDSGSMVPSFTVDGVSVAATNSGNVYTLAGISVGSHTVTIGSAGYTTGTLSGVMVTNRTTTAATITLAAIPGNIAITVSTSDSGTIVPVFTIDGVAKTATNSGNVYTLSGIAAGSHSITISGVGYTAGMLSGVNVTNNNTTTAAITLSRQTGSVVITLNTDDSRMPMPIFTVDGVTKSATQVGNVYTISGIATGSHRIEVASTDYTTGILTGVNVTENATTPATITLVATIVGGSVVITVSTSDSGSVVPSFTVDGVSAAATSNGNIYTLSNVSVGSHTITVAGAGYTTGTLSGVTVANRTPTLTTITLAAIPGSVAISLGTSDSGAVTPIFTVDGVNKTATSSGSVYTLSGIAAGSHIITVAGTGYTTGTLSSVNVTNNTTTPTSLILAAIPGSIVITVTTSDSGAITPSFTVDGVTKTATNVGNVYTLSGIAAGSHAVAVSGVGYVTGTLSGVSVINNASTNTSISLSPILGSVAITVNTSDNGSVVPSFTVDGVTKTATNSGNLYTLSDIAAGSHNITVLGTGYTTGTLNSVNVTNNTTTPKSITLAAIPGSIAITVSTSDGVAVTPTFTVDGSAKTATSSGSVYTLSGIAAGSHSITISGADYTTGTLNSVSVTNNTTTPTAIMLAALPGSVAITVTTSDSGAVTPTFSVDGTAKTATNSGNVYTLSGIAAGSHTIVVAGTDYTSQTVSNVTVTKNAVTSQSISLVPLPGSVAITVLTNDGGVVTPSFSVDGTIKTATNSGNVYTLSDIAVGSHTIIVSGADYTSQTLNSVNVAKNAVTSQSISLVPMPGSVAITVGTSDSGAVTPSFTVDGTVTSATKSGNVYTLSGIIAGSHNILVAGTDYTPQTLSNVMVTKNAVTPQSISLVALPGSVAITVSTSDSAAVTPSFTVGGTAIAATNSGNVYTLSGITPGSYNIVVAGTDYTSQTLSSVIVAKNSMTPQSTTLVALPGSVAITVSTSDSGAVTPSFTVGGTAKTATQSGNVYTLSGITPGSYTIGVSGAGYTPGTLNGVTVTKNTTIPKSITLVVQPAGGSASVTVTSSGSPVSGATVTVSGTALSGTTDGSGHVTISGIPAGSYIFSANAGGVTSRTLGTTTISVGNTSTVAIDLLAAGKGRFIFDVRNETYFNYRLGGIKVEVYDDVGVVASGIPINTDGFGYYDAAAGVMYSGFNATDPVNRPGFDGQGCEYNNTIGSGQTVDIRFQ